MTETDKQYLTGLGAQVAALVAQRLKEEGLVHDDRPLLSLEEAAVRLGVSRRVMGDMTRGVDGSPPVLVTVRVGTGGHKGVKVEPAEIDAYLERLRLAALAERSEGLR